MQASGVRFQFDPELFKPLIQQCVEETMARIEHERATVGDRLCYSEPEAAAMLGLEPHQLRDERSGAGFGPAASFAGESDTRRTT